LVFGVVIQLPPPFIFRREREIPTRGRVGDPEFNQIELIKGIGEQIDKRNRQLLDAFL